MLSTLPSYQEKILQFKKYVSPLYPLLGLIGEIGELQEKLQQSDIQPVETRWDEIEKEVGDVFWYLAAICNEFELDFQKIVMRFFENQAEPQDEYPSFILDWGYLSARFANFVKKADRDQDELPEDFFLNLEQYILYFIGNLFYNFRFSSVEEVDRILDLNIQKLTSRKLRGVISGSGDNR